MPRCAEDINDIESESGIIASLIRNPELFYQDEGLRPVHFTNKENKIMYDALSKIASDDIREKIDAYMVSKYLEPGCDISVDQIQDFIIQSELIARPDAASYKLLCKRVEDAALKRHLYLKLKECENFCFDKGAQEIESLIYEDLDNVMLEFGATTELPMYKDVIDEYWEEIEERQERDDRDSKVIKFPFPLLNNYVVMDPGECICFAAPQKAGKSAMLLTCAVDLLRKGKSVLYVDSELSSRLFTMRIIAHLTGIKFGLIRSGRYGPEERQKIEEAKDFLKNSKFIHRYTPMLDENQLLLMAKKAKHMMDIDVIIVDYLKANSNDDQAFSTYASLGRVSDTLKNRIAGEMGICALTAAQTTSTGKIADSARIARNVSTVITILDKTIEEYETDGTGATKKMRVLFNRNGDQHKDGEYIDMEFEGSLCLYREAKRQHAEQDKPF